MPKVISSFVAHHVLIGLVKDMGIWIGGICDRGDVSDLCCGQLCYRNSNVRSFPGCQYFGSDHIEILTYPGPVVLPGVSQ